MLVKIVFLENDALLEDERNKMLPIWQPTWRHIPEDIKPDVYLLKNQHSNS